MADPHQREVAIFEAAVQLPPEQRDAYLERTCADDAALLQRIRALLLAHESQTDFLTAPADQPTLPAPLLATEKPGDRIGPYKLLQQIGEGGCGVVYMAEQDKPVHRRVALKVIKLGMDTKQVIARFEAERQALAMMDHPNIAKVLDAGATDTGRPYFVMELVRGVKITEYCDHNNLPTRDRLDLFIQVCRAVQHAHQKGIIHRDIKPSNILVTLHDGVPVPKVIDFGIAKATQGPLTDLTLFTAFEQFLGTPAYMSPEQAEMSGLDIDTRSDIYSLGVLLYELLTGETPFEAKQLIAAGLEAMRRIICEKEPDKPSTKLSTMAEGELTTAAKRRHTEVPKLLNAVRGDLDWIVMKCLEKDRARRYETANGLARDIERHLAQEPVMACPPSNLYRFQKLVRRNKLVFGAGLAVLMSLLVGFAVSTWMYFQERAAKREQARLRLEAQAKEEKAQTEAAKSKQVAQLLKDALGGANSFSGRGRDTALLQEILENTRKRIDEELSNQPEVQAELFNTMGAVYGGIGNGQNAAEMYRRVVGFLRGRTGEDRALAAALKNLAMAQSKPAEAESVQQEAVSISRRLFPGGDEFLADQIWDLARYYQSEGRYPESEPLLSEAMAMYRRCGGEVSAGVARCLSLLADRETQRGRLLEAERLKREEWSIEKRAGAILVFTIGSLSGILFEEGKLEEAEELARQQLALRRRVNAKEHLHIAWALGLLSDILKREQKFEEAEGLARESQGMMKKLCAYDASCELELANSDWRLAVILRARKNFSEAEPFLRESVAIKERLAHVKPWWTDGERRLLCECLFQQKKFSEAELLLTNKFEAIKLQGKSQRPDQVPDNEIPTVIETASQLGRLYDLGGHVSRAEEWRAEATKWYHVELERYKKGAAEGNVQSMNSLALLLATCPDPTIRDGTNALKFAEKAAADSNREQPNILKTLAVAYTEVGQPAKAAEVEKEAANLLQYSKTNQFKWFHEEVQYYKKEIEKGNTRFNDLAWLLATCVDPQVRDGANAVVFAEKAVAKTERKDPQTLDTLAAAYAEASQFDKAVDAEKQAIALFQTEVEKKECAGRLKLYTSKTAYREY